MKRRIKICASGVVVSVVMSGQLLASSCMGRSASEADQVRYLQSAMMVAALQCRKLPTFKAKYNAFVTANRSQLQISYDRLNGWLLQSGTGDISSYLTSQANVVSAGTWRARTFCADMFAIATEANGSTNLLNFVARVPVSYAKNSKVDTCAATALAASE